MDRLAKLILNRRGAIAAVLILVTLLLGAAAARIRVVDAVENLLLYDDPERVYYRSFLERFGSDEVVVIAVRAPRFFAAENLARIERLREALADLRIDADASAPGAIDRVNSLFDESWIGSRKDASGESVLVIEPFLQSQPGTAQDGRALWRRAVNDPLYVGNLISPAKGDDPDAPLTALILGRIAHREGDLAYRRTILARVQEIVAREFGVATASERDPESEPLEAGSAVHLAGVPILKATMGVTAEHDLARTLPLTLLLIGVIFALLFRTAPAVLLPLLTVGLAVLWTVGVMSLTGTDLNAVSVAILPLVSVIGTVTTVHLFHCFYAAPVTVRGPADRVRHTLATIGWPCFLASFTTAVGFVSLGMSEIGTVREVGLYSAFGVMAAWLLAVLVVPLALVWIAARGGAGSPARGERLLRDALDRLPLFSERFRWPILAIAGALIALASVGIARIEVETDILVFLEERHPLREAYRFIGEELGGIDPLDITVTTPPGELIEPSVLSRIDALQAWLEEQPEVDATFSIVDYLKRLHQEMNDGDPHFYRLPESREAVAAYLVLLEGNVDLESLLYPDWQRADEARVAVRLRSMESADMVRVIGAAQAYLAANVASDPSLLFDRASLYEAPTGNRLLDGLYADFRGAVGFGAGEDIDPSWPPERLSEGQIATRITGVNVLYAVMVDNLVDGQLRSLLFAAAVIWITAMLVLRSAWAGTIAMIPNLFPVLVVFGLMGFVGITLNVGTAMIGSVCLGIAVDDTILFMTRYRSCRLAVGSERAAIAATLDGVGRPIVFTSAALALGFWIMCTSSFGPHFSFGLLAGVTVLAALVSDLVLLPACLLIFRPRIGELAP